MRKLFILLFASVMIACAGRNTAPAIAPETHPQAPLSAVVAVGDTLTDAPSDTLRLGRMRSGEVIEQWVGVRNSSQRPLVITRTETTCGCTNIDYPSQPIGVGDTARIAIRFDSQGFYGWQFKRIRLYTSADVRPISFYIEAEVE
ncbi:MAG: DUF1573 domain-containing protein [Rikenellaceae bacterium]|nr:DUF1573 domain-containing protein [Rikenellaceae bacterium]MBR2419985.1 DUF1573 domain-containing protein [Rikenellaceae bacterium]